ncbi:hypothetical protein [Streptomyces sp. NBC_00847]|uniref:hypothetical protein n=1 Tax=Streptomyces sp. NBC_00847 TaxID=2975850 RepID=UPI00225E4615|nr:hypothetical protein [Streptomyces sp. NBC_00847]MCX4885877.1 hypothetical protein [Streptomyces sp. NBC_00847]
MGRTRVVSVVAAVVLIGLGAAGCGGGGDDGGSGQSGGGGKASPSVSRSSEAAPRDALAAYQAATMSGCQGAADCQEFMTRKLAAAVQVRAAMHAKDPTAYAEPIGYVDQAERQADHFGRDSLGARGNMLAVSLPLQRMVVWFREHPEG